MKKNKKFIVSIMLIFLFAFSFSACGKKETNKTTSKDVSETATENTVDSTENNTEVTTTVTPTVTPTEAVTATPEATSNIPDVVIEAKSVPDTEAFQFVKDMKIGWNLGNTFDAFTDGNTVANELSYETIWCGVATSQPIIDTLYDAGFNSIRIPVSWHNHVSGDDFTISEAWLNRVQEVVDYAYNKGMYVILNTHHDNNVDFYYPTSEYIEGSKRYIQSIWSQLASRFADYNDHLIFESMNEPRMVGSNFEWWLDPNDDSCKDAVQSINLLNQLFVDTVRNGEGNNNNRYLMIPGYDASAQGALDAGYALPKDLTKDKLIVSVHAYTPYNFALQGPTESGNVSEFHADSKDSVKDIDSFMDQLYTKFISNGIPVVIGEFGARDKDGNTQDRIDYATYYIAAARARGMSCFWWDNNAFTGTGENFGLLDRKLVMWRYKDIVQGLMKYAN
ncbi:MAG: Cellulase [Anaerocolumna sp.]|jgi:endoglucanase|nr:Cellulase [Anaerocolumna sp.]